MRRITLAVLATVAIIVLLFSYRTSLGGGTAAQPAERAHVVSGTAASGDGTGQGPDPTGQVTAPVRSQTSAADPSSAVPETRSDAAQGSPPSGGAPQSSQAAKAAVPTVVDGDTEVTRYGPVQVRVTISSGRITDVTAIQYPTAERRDLEINSFALPQLRAEVLSAQSAHVDAVSGATFTTDGYLTSLQSALDAAHFQA